MYEDVEYIGSTKEDKVRRDGTHYNSCMLMLKSNNGVDNVNMKEDCYDLIQTMALDPLSPVRLTVDIDPSKDYPSGIFMVTEVKKLQQSASAPKPSK